MKQVAHKIKILHVEDQQSDAEQIVWVLNKAAIPNDILVVDSRAKFEDALSAYAPDIILSDHNLPKFNSLEALSILKESGLSIPFILVTGTVSEEFAVDAMLAGADDYILKDRMQRLPVAVYAAVEKFKRLREQKEAELKIHESEAKYRALFENSMDGMLLTITDGSILSANPAACEMLQMTEAEICRAGRFGIVDPLDPKVALLIEERQRTGRAKGEVQLVRKDGSKFPAELTSKLFIDALGHERTSIIFRDITQRRDDEERILNSGSALQNALDDLTKFQDSSLDMICAVDEYGSILRVSAACETILGYAQNELIGKRIFDFVYPEDVDKTLTSADRVMTGENIRNFENRYVRKDGSIVHLIWSTRWDAVDRIRYGVARDATDMKRAERMIASERKRLSDLFINAPVAMCILKGRDYVFELANPIYLELSGRKDVIGKTGREVFPEFEEQGVFKVLDNVFDTGEPFVVNEMALKIDREGNGQFTDVYQNILQQPYRDIDGNVAGIFYFGVDVTEQVLTRKRIEESQHRYRQIVETAQEGIWLVDEHDKTTFVNNKLCELFEYTREEMIGKDIYFFLDSEGEKIATESMQRRREGKSGKAHFKYISKTKREIWTNVSANPLFDERGMYKGSLAMITDITEQKKIAEENKKLAYVASLTVNAVIVTDAEGRITWVNQGFERITEYSFDEVRGKKPGDFLQGKESDAATVQMMRESREQKRGFRMEIINYSKSGRKYWLDIEVVPLLDNDNQLTGFMAIEQDITERKISEQETLNLITSLQVKNKDLQQFSYIVSHNLRAPVAKLLGLTNIMGDDPDENKALIQLITEEASNLDEVVKDINVIVSSRKADHEKREKAFFERKLQQIMQVLEKEIDESGGTIAWDFSEVPQIETIKSYLYSILYNLVSNAIKYRSPNVPLVVNLRTTSQNDFVCLSVQDNGRGIDLQKNGSKIFGLYKRFSGDAIPGKGIGLNLVKSHVESLGGRVEVESKLDQGSIFKIYLPKLYGTPAN